METPEKPEEIKPEQPVNPEQEAQDKTILIVQMEQNGRISWNTKLLPPQLNWVLDVMKRTLLNPPEEKQIVIPNAGRVNIFQQLRGRNFRPKVN